jgi:hypothetical protein
VRGSEKKKKKKMERVTKFRRDTGVGTCYGGVLFDFLFFYINIYFY